MLKNDHTDRNHVTISQEQERQVPITPAQHELSAAQLELVVGGLPAHCTTYQVELQFVKR